MLFMRIEIVIVLQIKNLDIKVKTRITQLVTDHGIVALPNNLVVHGYVWSKEVGWILKAHFPKGERRFRDKFSTFRGKKRKKELR